MKRRIRDRFGMELIVLALAIPTLAILVWHHNFAAAAWCGIAAGQALGMLMMYRVIHNYRLLAAHYCALSMFQTHRVSVLHDLLRVRRHG